MRCMVMMVATCMGMQCMWAMERDPMILGSCDVMGADGAMERAVTIRATDYRQLVAACQKEREDVGELKGRVEFILEIIKKQNRQLDDSCKAIALLSDENEMLTKKYDRYRRQRNEMRERVKELSVLLRAKEVEDVEEKIRDLNLLLQASPSDIFAEPQSSSTSEGAHRHRSRSSKNSPLLRSPSNV